MAYNVIFTVSGAGSDTGPFDISGTTNLGVTTLIQSGITKSTLEAGYEVTISDDNITGGTVASVGTCTNSQPWVKPTLSLAVYARDTGSNFPIMIYKINNGSNINIPNSINGTCSNIYTITGLTPGDTVTIAATNSCVISGAENTTSCPVQSGNSISYTTTINTPSPDTVAVTINSDIIP